MSLYLYALHEKGILGSMLQKSDDCLAIATRNGFCTHRVKGISNERSKTVIELSLGNPLDFPTYNSQLYDNMCRLFLQYAGETTCEPDTHKKVICWIIVSYIRTAIPYNSNTTLEITTCGSKRSLAHCMDFSSLTKEYSIFCEVFARTASMSRISNFNNGITSFIINDIDKLYVNMHQMIKDYPFDVLTSLHKMMNKKWLLMPAPKKPKASTANSIALSNNAENMEIYDNASKICENFYLNKEPSFLRKVEAAAALLIRSKMSYAGNGNNYCFTGRLDLKTLTKQIIATNRQATNFYISRLDFRKMLKKVPKNAILFIDSPYLDALLSACGTYDSCFKKSDFIELMDILHKLKNPIVLTHSDVSNVNIIIEQAGFTKAYHYGSNNGNKGFKYKTIVWTKNIDNPALLFKTDKNKEEK